MNEVVYGVDVCKMRYEKTAALKKPQVMVVVYK